MQPCTWESIDGKLAQERVSRLRHLLALISDPVVEQLALNSLLFVLFNTFVRTKTYNAVDRTLLKFFLEHTQDLIRELQMLSAHVKIFYYLTIFESEFGESIPQSLFNLKGMGKLFSENIKALKLEKSLERS